MKKLITLSVVFCAAIAASAAVLAADDMAGMKMDDNSMSATKPDNTALTDAVVRKVDPATGMITLQHGELKNVGMAAMTMAYKAKDASMVKQAQDGEKVKVRIENVGGTLTIVKLTRQ